MENHNGLAVEACLTQAGCHAERIATLHMIEPRVDRPQSITLAATKATTPTVRPVSGGDGLATAARSHSVDILSYVQY